MNGSSPRTPHRRWAALAVLVLLATFASLVVFFRLADVYHSHFFAISKGLALGYNAARLGLGVVILAGCLGIGGSLRSLLERWRANPGPMSHVDTLILDFFAGASVLGTFWYGAGLLGGLHPALAVAVHGLALIPCGPRLARCVGKAAARARTFLSGPMPGLTEVASGLLLACLLVAALASVAANFALNALVPGGTHDVYHHYFPYLVQVLERGNTLPNDVWYHFYYTKSQGLFFSAALLSDPLAPQIVSGVFVLATSLCVYGMLRVPLLPHHFALLGVTAFNLAFLTQEDWIFHQKNHIVMLGYLGWLLWHGVRLWQGAEGLRGGSGRWLGGLVACCFILNTPSAFVVALPFTGGLLLLALVLRSHRAVALDYFVLCAGLVLGLLGTFGLNHALMGMAEINPFRVFWARADVETLSRWVSPYLMVALEQGSGGGAGGLAAPLMKLLAKGRYYAGVLKPGHLAGLFSGAVGSLALAVGLLAGALSVSRPDATRRGVAGAQWGVAFPCLLLVVVTLVVGVVTRQGVSFDRFTGFALIPVAVLLVLLWQALLAGVCLRFGWGSVLAGALALALVCACALEANRRLSDDDQRAARAFLLGRASMADVYSRLDALWPPAHEIRTVIPPNARVRLMHIYHHSMAPYAPLETEYSFSLGKDWHTAMFAPPQEARACLERQGLNYFLVDTKTVFFDFLVFSPLFAPGSLEKNFLVAWRKGDVYLLTWAPASGEAEGQPAADMRDLLAGWELNLARSQEWKPMRELYAQILAIYEYNGRDAKRVALPPGLRPVQGFQ